MSRGQRQRICLGCGGDLPAELALAGSLRCHECRAAGAPLRADYARRQRAASGTNADVWRFAAIGGRR